MKIQNILTERFGEDDDYDYDPDPSELKRGYTYGELHSENEQVTVGNFLIKFKMFQETVESPTRYSRESPPENESYIGDVKKIEIDSVVIPSQNFDVPDLEYEISYPFNKDEVVKFNSFMQSFGENYDGEDKDKFDKFVGYAFHNDPNLAGKIFSAIDDIADKVYKGEI